MLEDVVEMEEDPFAEVAGIADHGEADDVEEWAGNRRDARRVDAAHSGSILVRDVEDDTLL